MSNYTAKEVAAAAVSLVSDLPGARIFVYIDAGPESEPTVFASGDEDDATDLFLAVGDWLDAGDEEEED
jgi:hypothetical protein